MTTNNFRQVEERAVEAARIAREAATKAHEEAYEKGFADGRESQWQPIETAPKDGTEVIGWHRGVGRHIVAYRQAERFEPDYYDQNLMRWRDSYGRYMNPTHWMPLPEPPK